MSKSPRDGKTKKKKTKKKIPTTLIQDFFYIYKRLFIFTLRRRMYLVQVQGLLMDQNVEFLKDVPFSKKSGPKRPSEEAKLPAEKPPEVPQNEQKNETSKKVPDPVLDSKTDSLSEAKNGNVVVDKLSAENESPIEIRKSPRIKKRPADDTGRKSSRKGKPKRRKECSFSDIMNRDIKAPIYEAPVVYLLKILA